MAKDEATEARNRVPEAHRADGFAVRVESARGHELDLKRLNSSKLTLMSVHPETPTGPEDALVWVPYGQVGNLVTSIGKFTQDTRRGNPQMASLVSNMEQIERAVIAHLWQEDTPLPPLDEERWWELWFDPRLPPVDPIHTLRDVADVHGWPVTDHAIVVGEYVIAHVKSTGDDLNALLATNACPVEIRRPSFAQEFHDAEHSFRRDLTLDLVDRVQAASADAPTVCLLDTGVNQEHRLLKPSLHGRAHTVLPGDNPNDTAGHGTQMAGLALFGDLTAALESAGPMVLTHGLESVKILAGTTTGPAARPRTYAEVTANGIFTAETATVTQPPARVFSMAVTGIAADGESGIDGTATLWSATLDALAAGSTVITHDDRIELLDPPDASTSRLIVVSVGNIRDAHQRLANPQPGSSHLDECDLARIEEPAQGHNILAVGAYTELTDPPLQPAFRGYRPLAAAGELSPWSRTSVAFTGPKAVIKPDIVAEGGNLLINDAGHVDCHDVVCVTTTDRDPYRLVSAANATSAATAQIARLAALAHAAYPDFSPEAVRGLLVHEARWTPAMQAGAGGLYKKTGRPRPKKNDLRVQLLSRYGWGVPTEDRIRASARSAVTLVVQDTLIPFEQRAGNRVGLAELNLHELPWPLDQLRDMADATVELRVTLSYMVEPNPGRRGMRGAHTYASHGLRFAIKAPLQSVDDFERCVAEVAETEGDAKTSAKAFENDDHWLLGPQNRNRGSLHSDVWRGSAVQLAECGVLAVYPVSGWWKTHNRQDRIGRGVTYALLVSLSTDVGTDLYTPIATQLGIPITALASPNVGTGTPIQLELG
ncbi:S8 family peptidase [Embleya sp. NPDC127516]|uniref:S8 family peptidase n=1 Tax=Embleya sp. NPDC127516 TaxID=3363990 RepID=UPI0037F27929